MKVYELMIWLQQYDQNAVVYLGENKLTGVEQRGPGLVPNDFTYNRVILHDSITH